MCSQLYIQRASGSVFKGCSKEKIYFAPTYKYSFNSDSYAGEIATSKKKRRTPAWYVNVQKGLARCISQVNIY
jgi:hypothetical protein